MLSIANETPLQKAMRIVDEAAQLPNVTPLRPTLPPVKEIEPVEKVEAVKPPSSPPPIGEFIVQITERDGLRLDLRFAGEVAPSLSAEELIALISGREAFASIAGPMLRGDSRAFVSLVVSSVSKKTDAG